jgi:hypothetical protein
MIMFVQPAKNELYAEVSSLPGGKCPEGCAEIALKYAHVPRIMDSTTIPCYTNVRSQRWGHSIRSKEQTAMTEQVSPLATFYKPGWEHYQQALVQTIAPLSSEQLALSLGPH